MRLQCFFIKSISAAVLLFSLWGPAQAEIYTWKDQEGVLNATNRRENVPADVKAEVLPELPKTPLPRVPKSAPDRSQQADAELSAQAQALPPATAPEENQITQGMFAVQLVGEIGFGQDRSPQEAADLLTQIRVSPPLGRWKFDEPMTPNLVARLRTLTVSAAQRGAISIQPEEALLAFDTTAALLGVSIPASSPSERSDSSSSSGVLDAPPLVLINEPPPQILSSYVWIPVDQGFFWNGTPCSGFSC